MTDSLDTLALLDELKEHIGFDSEKLNSEVLPEISLLENSLIFTDSETRINFLMKYGAAVYLRDNPLTRREGSLIDYTESLSHLIKNFGWDESEESPDIYISKSVRIKNEFNHTFIQDYSKLKTKIQIFVSKQLLPLLDSIGQLERHIRLPGGVLQTKIRDETGFDLKFFQKYSRMDLRLHTERGKVIPPMVAEQKKPNYEFSPTRIKEVKKLLIGFCAFELGYDHNTLNKDVVLENSVYKLSESASERGLQYYASGLFIRDYLNIIRTPDNNAIKVIKYLMGHKNEDLTKDKIKKSLGINLSNLNSSTKRAFGYNASNLISNYQNYLRYFKEK